MNTLITEETAKAQEPEKPIRSSSDLSLKFRTSQSSLKSRGSENSIRSRSSELSLQSPLQLPGMETEKGGELSAWEWLLAGWRHQK